MRTASRVVTVSFAVLLLMFLPIDWADGLDSMRWGTVPEWIGAVGIVMLAAAVWRIANIRTRPLDDPASTRHHSIEQT